MRGFIKLLSLGYAMAIYGFIFLPVVVLVVFLAAIHRLPHPAFHRPVVPLV